MSDNGDASNAPLLNEKRASEFGIVPLKATWKRWLIVFLFLWAGAANSMVLLTWSPIFSQATTYFSSALGSNSVSTGVNMFFSAFQIMFLSGTLGATLMLKKYGLRVTLLYAGLLTCVGCLLRWGIAQSHSKEDPNLNAVSTYVLILLGTFFVAQVQPVYLNLPTVISMTWFGVGERDFAMTILSLANTAGSAIGSIVPSLLVPESDQTASALGPDIANLLLVQLCVAAASLVCVYFAFANAPPEPPSLAAEQLLRASQIYQAGAGSAPANAGGGGSGDETFEDDEKQKVLSVRESVHRLLGNTQYVLVLCGFSCAIGSLNSLASLLGQLPTNNTSTQVGLIGFSLILSGFVGAVACGVVLSAYKAYATTLKVAYCGAVVSWVCFFLSAHNDNFNVMCLFGALTGFFVLATIPAGLQNAVECTYPVSEDISVGLLYLTANLVTIPYTFIGQAVLGNNGSNNDDKFDTSVNNGVSYCDFGYFSTSMIGFGCICVLFYRAGDYKRLQMDIVAEIDGFGNERVSTSGRSSFVRVSSSSNGIDTDRPDNMNSA
jgi:FLVCR family MFS transporter 7